MKVVVDILILGAGWTSTFLIALCDEREITHASTSRSGRENTLKFIFDPDSDDLEPYSVLPDAQTILITFPIDKKGASERLVKLYSRSRGQESSIGDTKVRYIQLGATSIWDGRSNRGEPTPLVQHKWYDRRSVYLKTPRAEAEDELLALAPTFSTTVLNLAGLWGGQRTPKNWVAKVAPTKEALKIKGSLHVIHGLDVARCILAVVADFDKAEGQRWILTDGRIYDWWDLASAWGSKPAGERSSSITGDKDRAFSDSSDQSKTLAEKPGATIGEEDRGPQAAWVRELMQETGIRALPRPVEQLGRAVDSRDFWIVFGLSPLKARIEQ